MQHGRGQKYKVVVLYRIGDTLQKVDGVRAQENMDLIVRMKMLKLHIYLAGAHIEVKKIKQGMRDIIDDDKLFFAVVNGLNH